MEIANKIFVFALGSYFLLYGIYAVVTRRAINLRSNYLFKTNKPATGYGAVLIGIFTIIVGLWVLYLFLNQNTR